MEDQELLRIVFDHIPIMIGVMDRNGAVRMVNREWERVLGWGLDQARAIDLLAQAYPDAAELQRVHSSIAQSDGQWREFRTRTARGETIDTLWANVGLSDGSCVGIGQDLTLLRQSEERFRLLIEHSLEWIAIVDAEARMLYGSPAVGTLLGYSLEELKAVSLAAYIHPEDQARVWESFGKCVAEPGSTVKSEVRVRHKDGSYRTFESASTNLLHVKGVEGMLLNCRDITERKAMESQLRASHDQLRQLAAHLESIREEERTRVAREVHDELGQLLTALKMGLGDIGVRMDRGNRDAAPEIRTRLNEMSGMIDASIGSVRRISAELRPAVLDHLGLSAALEWQMEEFHSRTGIRCRFSRPRREPALSREQSTALFRIFQEILTNVARHARAASVHAALRGGSGEAVLTVRDDGVGIAPDRIFDPASLGLLGMRERALLLGGSVEVGPGLRKCGTAVRVRIPAMAR